MRGPEVWGRGYWVATSGNVTDEVWKQYIASSTPRMEPRLRAERPNHVWPYDFVEDRTHEGRKYRMLNLIDEYTHECLAIRVDRRLKSVDVIDVLSDLFILRGDGPEFVAKTVQDWIAAVGAKTAYIAPGSPWENGFIESFNARHRTSGVCERKSLT